MQIASRSLHFEQSFALGKKICDACTPNSRQAANGRRSFAGRAAKARRKTRFLPVAALVDPRLLGVEAVCLVGVSAALFKAYKPHGWCDGRLVEVQESSIQGKGVFARRDIPSGTVIGSYPGFARRATEMAAKIGRKPLTQYYIFNALDGWYLDPTDSEGRPLEKLWGMVETTLAFTNEPPPRYVTNLEIVDGKTPLEVLFVTSKDVFATEELLVDYGTAYDRSGYGQQQSAHSSKGRHKGSDD